MFGKDTNPATKPLPDDKFCELCGKKDDSCRICTGCRRVRYCGPECQNAHGKNIVKTAKFVVKLSLHMTILENKVRMYTMYT